MLRDEIERETASEKNKKVLGVKRARKKMKLNLINYLQAISCPPQLHPPRFHSWKKTKVSPIWGH